MKILASMAGWEAGGAAPSLSDLCALASKTKTLDTSCRAGLSSPAHGLGAIDTPGGAAVQPTNPALAPAQTGMAIISYD
jgi:hypothetical protein